MLSNILEYFSKGGILMYPLVTCSIIALGISINRLSVFKQTKIKDESFLKDILSLIQSRNYREAQDLCIKRKGLISDFIVVGIKDINKGKEAVESAFEDAGLIIIDKLERYLPILSTIATVSTLIGFTGTVIGMIKAFNSIALQGVSSPTVVATGIAEALITTATGLLVAVPTIVFYHYFIYRLDRTVSKIELFAIEFVRNTFNEDR